MKPIRTPESTTCYALPGGNEDSFLYGQEVDGVLKSTWLPSEEERQLIAGGARVVLLIWGALVPPVAIGVDRPFCPRCKKETVWDVEQERYHCIVGHDDDESSEADDTPAP